MTQFKLIFIDRLFIFSLALSKLLFHLFTNTNYGFHRDEFLYLDQGNHLGWGFMEVPPFTPLIGKITTIVLGDSLFAVRFLPAVVGALSVIIICMMVKELGGKGWAILFACTAFIFSPAFLRSNTLFQPVFFNQFWWLLSAFLLVKLVNSEKSKYWYFLGLVAGLGFLTKYAIVFFLFAIFLALLFSPQRKWLTKKHLWLGVGLAFLIALPNLLWQWQHQWPVVHHMSDLARTQLVNVEPAGFLIDQLTMQLAGLLVWIPGVIWFLRRTKYRFLGLSFLFLLTILLLSSGKSYYTLGAYTMLMAAGGLALEQFFKDKKPFLKYALLVLILIPNLFILPMGLPVLSIEKMKNYSASLSNFGFENRWEDGKIYDLPQDYADMFGWEEMAQIVAEVYHGLSPEEKKNCNIYGGGYSHAGVLNYYREKYDLPETMSFSSSYILWVPDSIHFERQIMVDDVFQTSSSWFNNMVLVDSIQNPNAREPGYVYFRDNPKINVDSIWSVMVKERRAWE